MNPEIPVKLDDVIQKALEKDRNLRYQSAAEMRTDLQRLKRETDSHSSPVAAAPPARQSQLFPWIAAATVVGVGSVLLLLLWHGGNPAAKFLDSSGPKAIAVLPFQKAASTPDIDFLRLALADEIATELSHVASISVRPSATTGRYDGPKVDLQQAAHDMGVSSIVTGHFLKQTDHLEVTLEAIDIKNDRTIWRDSVDVASSDTIAMRREINARIREGLIPRLGVRSGAFETDTRPQNQQAYDLFLRSIPAPHDGPPNKDAMAMLERSVELDPEYAPAWEALAYRYLLQWRIRRRGRVDAKAIGRGAGAGSGTRSEPDLCSSGVDLQPRRRRRDCERLCGSL